MVEIYDFESRAKRQLAVASKRADKHVNAVFKYLKNNKSDIENLICIIKFKDEDISLVYNAVDIEHWSRASKMLDYKVFQEMHEISKEIEGID